MQVQLQLHVACSARREKFLVASLPGIVRSSFYALLPVGMADRAELTSGARLLYSLLLQTPYSTTVSVQLTQVESVGQSICARQCSKPTPDTDRPSEPACELRWYFVPRPGNLLQVAVGSPLSFVELVAMCARLKRKRKSCHQASEVYVQNHEGPHGITWSPIPAM